MATNQNLFATLAICLAMLISAASTVGAETESSDNKPTVPNPTPPAKPASVVATPAPAPAPAMKAKPAPAPPAPAAPAKPANTKPTPKPTPAPPTPAAQPAPIKKTEKKPEEKPAPKAEPKPKPSPESKPSPTPNPKAKPEPKPAPPAPPKPPAPPALKWERLDIYPPDVELSTNRDRQQVIVTVTRNDGVTKDVTQTAKISLADTKLARLEKQTLYPQADGETKLRVEFEGLSQEIPVLVKAAGEGRPVNFDLDVMPVLMRTGCNSGSCHGSASGKDGFQLSLFGFDPKSDYHRLTREMTTRRINLAIPQDSLFLEKSIGAVTHSGGKRFDSQSEYYATLLQWLEAGAPASPKETAKVESLEIYPPAAVLEGKGASQQFIARAKYSDGTDRDVTDLVVFLGNNETSAPISTEGMVTAGARGEAFIMARFETKTVGSQVLVLPQGARHKPRDEQPVNYIDELAEKKLAKLRITSSPLCSDEVFLRRVTLDITGAMPTPDQYEPFVADKDPQKRAKMIDTLLEQKGFAELWALKWAEILLVKTQQNRVEYKPMFLYSNWLSQKIADNEPLDQIVQDLLGATGGTFSEPATNFYQVEPDTKKISENVAQVFLGIRMQCAQCHNHPFDRWTMDDYYGFAAFFSQIGKKRGEDYRETIVFSRNNGEMRHPVGNAVVAPKFLGGPQPETKGKDRRKVLAQWITSPENPYFAKSVGNRIWEHHFGIGIVNPVDDVRVSNPPSNPELYDALGQKLIEYNYDFKRLVRDVCNSNTYQRATVRNTTNATDESNFSHGTIRRIRAENLLDCISQVTETKDKFRGLPLGARAVQIADGRTSTYFLTTFGRSKRDTVCACEATTSPSLSQALHLLNGSTIEGKIRQGKVIERLLDEGKSPEQVIDDLVVRCLSRRPTAQEKKSLLAMCGDNPRPVAELQDAFWALLNSREFLFNR